MNSSGLISRMLTGWATSLGSVHRRLETREIKPVKAGDTIHPSE
jgi:3-hydroxybutyryl-CoA dehydratase